MQEAKRQKQETVLWITVSSFHFLVIPLILKIVKVNLVHLSRHKRKSPIISILHQQLGTTKLAYVKLMDHLMRQNNFTYFDQFINFLFYNQGILMVKKNGLWGSVKVSYFQHYQIKYQNLTPLIVCDSWFSWSSYTSKNQESACRTLGFTDGSHQRIDMGNQGWEWQWWLDTDKSKIPIFLNDVECDSGHVNFLTCRSGTWINCDHSEDILLTCF